MYDSPSSSATNDTGVNAPPPDAQAKPAPPGSVEGVSSPDVRPADFSPAMLVSVGPYRLLKQLGGGAMGSLYLAEDPQQGRQIALRVRHFQDGDGMKQAESFLRAARAATRLTHPNACPIYDVGQAGDVCYLAMPFITGPSLAAHLREKGCLAVDQAVPTVIQIAQAMHAAHELGIVHYDLRPAHVLLTHRLQVLVVDYGLAPDGYDQESILYLAPEQLVGDVGPTPVSNVYSLGVILYELLTGRLPFRGARAEMAAQIMTAEPPRLSQYRSGLSVALEAACLSALARDPVERIATMADFAAELTRAHYPDLEELNRVV